ncbi:MAG: hypothetical protein LBQ86_06235 [Holophagales bacterium]|jgi:hypothetical protein|nr:hypothetical protein [Holophagales bacterium]
MNINFAILSLVFALFAVGPIVISSWLKKRPRRRSESMLLMHILKNNATSSDDGAKLGKEYKAGIQDPSVASYLKAVKFDAVGFVQHMQQVSSNVGLRKMGLERIEVELAEARRGRYDQ